MVRIFMARLYLRESGRGGRVRSESVFKAKGYGTTLRVVLVVAGSLFSRVS